MFNVNVENVKSELGSKALHRAVEQFDGAYAIRENGVKLTRAI
jgi:hypothetical protein